MISASAAPAKKFSTLNLDGKTVSKHHNFFYGAAGENRLFGAEHLEIDCPAFPSFFDLGPVIHLFSAKDAVIFWEGEMFVEPEKDACGGYAKLFGTI